MKRKLTDLELRNDEAVRDEIRGLTAEDARLCAMRMQKAYDDLMRACEDLLDRTEVEAGEDGFVPAAALRAFEQEVGYRA